MPESFDITDRGTFLNFAGMFEGGLAFLTLGLGWLLGVNPLEQLEFTLAGVLRGLLGAVPLFLVFGLLYRFPVGPMKRIKQAVLEFLGPSLAACRWYDLILLALLVGFSEELLFRGLLQPYFGRWGLVSGLLVSNLIFGLLHCVTAVYALLTALIGLYLGWLMIGPGDGNLLVPMTTHAVYDYVGFLVVIADLRRRSRAASSPENSPEN